MAALFGDELFPEYSPSQRGAKVADQAGCFSCHGLRSDQGSLNPSRASEPSSFSRVPSIFEERYSVEVLREWIEEGISSEKRQSKSHTEARKKELLHMPPYKGRLSSDEIDDLMAFLALTQYSVAAPSYSAPAPGEELVRRFACFTCHGELGQGGVKDLGSLKGYIPGFFGQDFRALTRNGNLKDIFEWIENGASDSFLNQGFLGFYPGRFFSERQVIKMPAYKELLPPDEIQIIAEFVLELLSQGPLSAAGLHIYRPLAPDLTEGQIIAGRDQDPVSYDDDLFHKTASILTRSCLGCHGPKKQRSGYRMDTRDAALKGGEIADFTKTAAVVPGNSKGGLLVQFVEALEEDLDNEIYPMPPDENPRLGNDEIQVLKSWIDQGAGWPKGYQLKLDSE